MPRLRLPSSAALLALLLGLLLSAAPARAQGEEEAEDVAPFVPTPMNAVAGMLEMAGVTGRDTVYDLGSGDGRLPIAAAHLHGARAVGVELDSGLVARSRENARDAGVDSLVRFVRGDLFETDLTGASVVTLYLFPEVHERLRPKLLRQLDPGDRVVTHDFSMGDWTADSTTHVPAPSTVDGAGPLEWLAERSPDPVPGPSTVYLFTVPAAVDGTWRLRLPGGRTVRLRVDQRFQRLRVDSTGAVGPESTARVEGERIRLDLRLVDGARLRLAGTAREGRMTGRTSRGKRWSARRVPGTAGSVLEWEEAATPAGKAPSGHR